MNSVNNPLAGHPGWPDALDGIALGLFFALAIALPVLGVIVLCMDVRRWFRPIKGALVRVANFLPGLPDWARGDTPRCVAAMGLRLPCTVQELKHAYRQKVKQCHPDHGGNEHHFRWLQSQFEEALALVEPRNNVDV